MVNAYLIFLREAVASRRRALFEFPRYIKVETSHGVTNTHAHTNDWLACRKEKKKMEKIEKNTNNFVLPVHS